MHIISKIVKIQRPKELTVENIIQKLGFEPVRWAIIEAKDEELTLNCACYVSENS